MPQSTQILVELVLCPLTLAGGAFGPIIAKLIFLLQKICTPNSSVICFFDEIVSFKTILFLVSVLLRSVKKAMIIQNFRETSWPIRQRVGLAIRRSQV